MAQIETEPTSITVERIRSRILADEIFAFAESECAEAIGTPEFVTRFWSLLAAKIAEKIGSTVETPAPQSERQAKMTDAESKAFEQRECTFGTHKGAKFSDIPLSYLTWRADQSDIKADLRRYLASDRIVAEMAKHYDDDE